MDTIPLLELIADLKREIRSLRDRVTMLEYKRSNTISIIHDMTEALNEAEEMSWREEE